MFLQFTLKVFIFNNTNYPDVIRVMVRWCLFAFSWTFFKSRLHCASFWNEHHLVVQNWYLNKFFEIFEFLMNWLHICPVSDARTNLTQTDLLPDWWRGIYEDSGPIFVRISGLELVLWKICFWHKLFLTCLNIEYVNAFNSIQRWWLSGQWHWYLKFKQIKLLLRSQVRILLGTD